MSRRCRCRFLFAFVLGGGLCLLWAPPVLAQDGIAVAGELLVNLRADHASAGEAVWTNEGSLGDFERIGDPAVDYSGNGAADGIGPTKVTEDGVPAVEFNMQVSGLPLDPLLQDGDAFHHDSYDNADIIPDEIAGGSDRTIEVVAKLHSFLLWEQRMVSGPFNFEWGSWRNGSALATGGDRVPGASNVRWWPPPSCNEWHHLAITFDGFTVRLYVDGELNNCEIFHPGWLNVGQNSGIAIGASPGRVPGVCEKVAGCGGRSPAFHGHIAAVRVHDGALTAEQIQSNYMADKASFGLPDATPVTEQGPETTGSVPYPSDSEPAPALPDGQTIHTGGELFVSLDANDIPGGDGDIADVWPNQGTSGGDFFSEGTPRLRILEHGIRAVELNLEQLDCEVVACPDPVTFEGGDAYQQDELPPEGLVRTSDRTAEIWMRQSIIKTGRGGAGGGLKAIRDRENPISLGKKCCESGQNGNVDVVELTDLFTGDVYPQEVWRSGEWSATVGTRAIEGIRHWGEEPGWAFWHNVPPQPGEWTHVVWSWSGGGNPPAGQEPEANRSDLKDSFLRIYKNGVLHDGLNMNSTCLRSPRGPAHPQLADGRPLEDDWSQWNVGAAAHSGTYLDTFGDVPITIGDSVTADGELGRNVAGGDHEVYNGYLAVVRLHDTALNAGQVRANYEAEKARFYRSFIPGDCNADGNLDLSDGVAQLNFSFTGGAEPSCLDACDFNGSGGLDITNAVYFFNALFAGGPPIAGVTSGYIVTGYNQSASSGDCGIRAEKLGCAQATCDFGRPQGYAPPANGQPWLLTRPPHRGRNPIEGERVIAEAVRSCE
jgi:hypothetical protein